jgi:hypothetical protein
MLVSCYGCPVDMGCTRVALDSSSASTRPLGLNDGTHGLQPVSRILAASFPSSDAGFRERVERVVAQDPGTLNDVDEAARIEAVLRATYPRATVVTHGVSSGHLHRTIALDVHRDALTAPLRPPSHGRMRSTTAPALRPTVLRRGSSGKARLPSRSSNRHFASCRCQRRPTFRSTLQQRRSSPVRCGSRTIARRPSRAVDRRRAISAELSGRRSRRRRSASGGSEHP